MIVKRSRVTFLAFLYLLSHLFLASCSTTGDELDEEALEVDESGEEYVEEGDEGEFVDEQVAEENGENFENNYENNYENDYSANEGLSMNEGENLANYDNEGSNYLANDEAANQDLQQIISDAEMNNSGMNEIEPAIADAPVNAGMDMAPMTEEVPSSADTYASAGTSAGPALPEMGSKMPYIVQAGDTLGKIASKIYGNPERWADIRELSALPNPNKVYPGDVVYYQLTQETVAFASTYEGLPRVEIVVQHGDTLSGIAAQVTGSWANWKNIWRQNADIENPDKLTVGQTLYYVNINALSAAVNFVKDVKVADLLNVKEEQKTETTTVEVEQVTAPSTVSTASLYDVSSSELVKDVLSNVLARINNSLAS